MATKSIYKDIRIKNKALAGNFISALEHAQEKGSVKVEMSKTVQDIKDPETIKKIFGERR